MANVNAPNVSNAPNVVPNVINAPNVGNVEQLQLSPDLQRVLDSLTLRQRMEYNASNEKVKMLEMILYEQQKSEVNWEIISIAMYAITIVTITLANALYFKKNASPASQTMPAKVSIPSTSVSTPPISILVPPESGKNIISLRLFDEIKEPGIPLDVTIIFHHTKSLKIVTHTSLYFASEIEHSESSDLSEPPEPENCTICLNEVNQAQAYIKFAYGHVFHFKCIMRYIIHDITYTYDIFLRTIICPNCRAIILEVPPKELIRSSNRSENVYPDKRQYNGVIPQPEFSIASRSFHTLNAIQNNVRQINLSRP
ncbi:18589_t:CDS:2, partial [Funneliformis geosporum]